MAKISDISINVGVAITDETMERCRALLTMWLEDNPGKELETFEWHDGNSLRRSLEVRERRNDE